MAINWGALLSGAIGKTVQKAQQYIAPKQSYVAPQQTKAPTQSYAKLPMSSSTNTQAANYKLPMSSATNSSAANYRPSSATQSLNISGGGGSSSGGGGSSYSSPFSFNPINNTSVSSIFRNNISSLIPKAYASDGLQAPTSSGGTWSNLMKGLTASFNKIGAGNIATGGKTTTGTWFGLPELGFTETGSSLGNYAKQKVQGYLSGGSSDINYSPAQTGTGALMLKKRQQEEAARQAMLNKGNTGSVLGATANGTSYDQLSQIDEATNAKLDALQEQVNAGMMGAEEAATKAKEIQDQANALIYDQLIAQQQGEIPLLESEFNNANTSLTNSTAQAAADAKAVKANNVNTYGEAMRKMVGNRDIGQKNINDVYTAAGTAGGSDYLQAISGIQRDTGNNLANSERDLTNQNATIDRQQQGFENQVKDKVNTMLLEKQRALKTINDNVNMSRAQKAAASLELNSQLATQLQNIRQQRDDRMNQFTAMKQQLAIQTGEMAKQGIMTAPQINPYASLNAGSDPSKQAADTRATKINGTNLWQNGKVLQKRFNPLTGKVENYYS